MADQDIKQIVRDKYGKAALRISAGDASCCSGSSCCEGDASADPITSNLYTETETGALPAEAVAASLGCGNPTALAELRRARRCSISARRRIDVLLSQARGRAARRTGST